MIDVIRTQAAYDRAAGQVILHDAPAAEQCVLDELERTALWRLVSSLAKTEAERVVLVERFVLDLPPRAILARHPSLFADVLDVYSAQRNLCVRLRKNRDLQLLRDQNLAA